jgi:hypothetical protein
MVLGGTALIVGLTSGIGVWLFKRLIDLSHWAAFEGWAPGWAVSAVCGSSSNPPVWEIRGTIERRANKIPETDGLRYRSGSGEWIRTTDLRVMSSAPKW